MWSRSWPRWARRRIWLIPAETAGLRGRKKRAKTDRADARLLRTLLLQGRLPESWIPPAHVLEVRTLGRLYCALSEERRAWRQRIHAQLFHQGCPPITTLLTEAGREALAGAELSATGRQYVDTALRRIDELTAEIDPVRMQLINFARRQVGCRALQARQYGVGWLCAAIMWAEIGDARRFHSSDQLVRFAGMDVTVYSSDGKRSPGRLSRQGPRCCGGATFEAASARPAAVPRTTPTTAGWPPARQRQERDALSVARKTRPAGLSHRCGSSATPRWPSSDRSPRHDKGIGRLNALCACAAQGQLMLRPAPAKTPVADESVQWFARTP